MRIAVTGALGEVGSILSRILKNRGHVLTLLDREKPDGVVAASEAIEVDLSSVDLFANHPHLFANQDAIIHLANCPKPWESFETIWRNNIFGDYNVLQLAVSAGVKRFVYASSTHIQHGRLMQEGNPETLDFDACTYHAESCRLGAHEIDPSSYYGVGKAHTEALGKYFARTFGIEFIAMRVGWLVQEENPFDSHWVGTKEVDFMRSVYVSHEDAGEFFGRACENTLPEEYKVGKGSHAVCYAISANDLCPYDNVDIARSVLQYEPKHNAESFLKN